MQYAAKNDMIDLSYMQEQIDMNRRKELLNQHPYKMWQGQDGKWYTHLMDDGKRILIKRVSKEELEDAVFSYYKECEESPTIKETFQEWNDRQLEIGNIKRATHSRNQETYKRHLGKIADKKIGFFDSGQWELFIQDELAGRKLTSKAYGNLRTVVKGMLGYARRKGWIDYSPNDIFPNLDITKRTFKDNSKTDADDSFSLDEYYTIIDYLSKKENQTIHNLAILLMFVTGLRVGELVTLKYSDIDKNIIHVQRTETRYKDNTGKFIYEVSDTPKTAAGVRDVPIPKDYQWVLKSVRRLNPFGEYIFMYRKKRITTFAVRKMLYKVCDEVGIQRKSPHKARKTYATILLESSTPEYMVKRILGHTDALTTERYYHRYIGNESEYSMIDDIPEFEAR